MQSSNKWMVIALIHLAIVGCLTAGVALIAIRMSQHSVAFEQAAPATPVWPQSDAEIARLHLLQKQIDVMQYNLANADTTAYKRQLVNVQAGSPPKIDNVHLDTTQGMLESTHCDTDVAIQGEGFFRVKISDNVADGTAYTRDGSFQRSPTGDLVVGLGVGLELIPPIKMPRNATNIVINQDGTVTYQSDDPVRVVQAGQIQLYHFVNPQMLQQTDNGLYTECTMSGPPVADAPGTHGTGELFQGFLEASNVDPMKEWAQIQRAQTMLQYTSLATHGGSNQLSRTKPIELAAGGATLQH